MRGRALAYEALMKRPALRITSKAGDFAFRNVPHRITALGGDPHELEAAAQRFASIPDIQLELVPGQTAAGQSAP
jgi:hypothetical protein